MSHSIERRKFIRMLPAGTGLALAGLSLTNEAQAGESNITAVPKADAFGFRTAPYLQNPEPDGMTICWLVSKPAHSWVEYWPAENDKQKSQSIAAGLVTAHNTTNKIRLKNLQPGVQYAYKVYSKEIITFQPYKKVFGETVASETFHFTTPDPKQQQVSMLILNDIHDRPHSFAALEKLNGGDHYDMVFLNGDMFDHQESEDQLVKHLIEPCCTVFASQKPFLFVRGNHETRGVFSYQLDNYFENIGKAPYFHFKRGPVFFVALDTGEDKEDNHEAYYGLAAFDPFREEQSAWLNRILQTEEARKATYRVILMHIPPFHSGEWHGTTHCRKVFTPIFEKHKVSMVISGHTHRYGVHAPQADHSYPIIIGGGPKEGSRTIIRLKADKKQLSVTMIADNGQVVGTYGVNGR